MNNKELTELKGKMREFGELIDRWASLYGIELSDKAKTALSYEMATNYISNDEIKRGVGRCKLCNKETDCVYNINLKATSICEGCGRAIAKQELDDMFQAQKENNE